MSWAVVAYVLVAVSADVRRGLVRGAVVVTQLVAHDTPGVGRSLRVCFACPSREMPSPRLVGALRRLRCRCPGCARW